ncbi:MAG: DUF1453 domain-containing protein [Proteobacteria bacterium]|nr:DUF1453 domain-containing protein [Pseudomonadota bacterium]
MDPKLVTPILVAAFVLFAIYRRVRRNIGRQRVQPTRMRFRVIVLGVVGALVLAASVRNVQLFEGMLAGIAGGVALGWLGLRHTKFETTEQGRFYTPHTWIGLAVSALLLGRIAYRFMLVYPGAHAAAQMGASPFASYQKSPLTMAIFGVVVGYYVAYYVGVLVRSTQPSLPG